MSITLWRSEADRLAADTSGLLMEQIVKVMPLLAMPPVLEGLVAHRMD